MATMKYKDKKLGRPRKGVYIKKIKGFPAKYPGKCMICDKAVKKNELIGWFEYGKVYHIRHLEEG